MNTDELVSRILKHCSFEELTLFFEYYSIHNIGNDNTPHCTGNTFRYLVKKFGINQYELSKEQDVSKLQNTYSRIRSIGNKYKKKSKDGTSVYYTKNPTLDDALLLKENILSSKKNRIKISSRLSEFSTLGKIDLIIKYLNLYTKSDFDFLLWNYDDVKEHLMKQESELLKNLFKVLDNETYLSYFDEPEPADEFDIFLDDTNINTLFFIYYNSQIILNSFETIAYLANLLKFLDDKGLNSVLIHLKEKRSVKNIEQNFSMIIETMFTDTTIIDNEFDFRYNTMHTFLCSLNDDVCNELIWTFIDMTPTKWDIIRHILRTYSSSCTKPVENFIKKWYKTLE